MQVSTDDCGYGSPHSNDWGLLDNYGLIYSTQEWKCLAAVSGLLLSFYNSCTTILAVIAILLA